MTCRAALLKLNRQGLISLPEPVDRDLFVVKKRQELADVPEGIAELVSSLEQLGQIELIPIEIGDRIASRTWNRLMDTYHYLGSGPLCGAQIRYLVKSTAYGWIGGLAFSAAAWHVKARDQWIGWTNEARQRNLSKIICNSRFLLVPKVPNLGSHILSRCAHRIREDWHSRYRIEPVLIETYVEKRRFAGTCYQAANWLHVGSTQGPRPHGPSSYSTHSRQRYLCVSAYPASTSYSLRLASLRDTLHKASSYQRWTRSAKGLGGG